MKGNRSAFLLLTPFLLLMFLFCIGLVNGLAQSVGILPAFGMYTPTFHYYKAMLASPDILASIGLSLWIALISSGLAVVLGTILCAVIIMLGEHESSKVYLIKTPIVVPHTVVALLVILIFGQSGILSRLAYALGFVSTPYEFPMLLYDQYGIGIIIAYLWKEIPFVCYYVIATMSNISETYEQAAVNLGATRLKSFFYITLPLCKRSIQNSFLILFAFSFGAYELPYLLGSTLPKALPVRAFIEYNHPDLLHRPYAMTINSLMIILSIVISAIYYHLVTIDRKEKESKYPDALVKGGIK